LFVIYWIVYIEKGEVKFVWCANVHLAGYMNKNAELLFLHIIRFSCFCVVSCSI